MGMRQHHYFATINLSARSQVEINIQYDFEPYHEAVVYYPDDGMCEPPWGPEIEIWGLYIVCVIAHSNRIERSWLQDRGWLKVVEDLVWTKIINDDDLRYDLIHNAEDEYEDF